ncbi:hypothetical protein MPH_10818 [Macrophomina phaseolina MS6]|uniref:Uncharacterized protein n=1 Tax=Macrophomina phaseolina (strain MS6) TaxID=1126212 RepID=K2QQ84_MACPH|nr:hypothetical protein MPH_10818 [Macrophomina phaseolina MS6]
MWVRNYAIQENPYYKRSPSFTNGSRKVIKIKYHDDNHKMDVPELHLSSNEQFQQLRTAEILIERILAVGRSLLGSNRFLDVITYRLPNAQEPDYVAELLEHAGPVEARVILHGRGGGRNKALFLLLDKAERELNITMSTMTATKNGVTTVNTRRMGIHRCTGCSGTCGGSTA